MVSLKNCWGLPINPTLTGSGTPEVTTLLCWMLQVSKLPECFGSLQHLTTICRKVAWQQFLCNFCWEPGSLIVAGKAYSQNFRRDISKGTLLIRINNFTCAGIWIHIAGLRRTWSHSCFSKGTPFCKLLRYFEKARHNSSTARVTWALEDCKRKSA